MKKLLLAAAITLVAAPAFAQAYDGPSYRPDRGSYDPDVTGSIAAPPTYARPGYAAPAAGAGGYSFNPAADGNAEQQAKPVKNYGQVSGGPTAATGW